MKTNIVLLALFVALMTTGFECFQPNNLVAINIKGISGTYKINPGNNPNFNDCAPPITASDYIDENYLDKDIKDVRVYNIRVTTIGTYAGDINGTATINGVSALSYNGSWGYFNTPRTILTDPNVVQNLGALSVLRNSILGKQPITLCGVGSVDQVPVPDGLYVKIEVLGQIDVQPGG